jgi:hypothetical protein
VSNVANSKQYDADPVSGKNYFHFDVDPDPDPAFHFDADVL